MSQRPNPLVPPFPPANLKAGWEAVQRGKKATTQSPREAEYLAAIEVFYQDYESVDQSTRARLYEQAMESLHQHYPNDREAVIFYALALNEAVDFDDQNFTKQLKAAALLNKEARNRPNHPGIAHYLIHSYDFAPLAALCVSTAQLYDKIAAGAPHALHMPSHIYSMLGIWDDSVRSNLAAEAAANEYAARNFPDATDPAVPTFWISASTPICRLSRMVTRRGSWICCPRTQEIRDCAAYSRHGACCHSGALCT